MRSWSIKQIVALNVYCESTIKRAIYVTKKLPVIYSNGVRSPRVLHSDLVDWLGFDPLKQPNMNLEITKTVKTKGKTVTTTTRIKPQDDGQMSLFDKLK